MSTCKPRRHWRHVAGCATTAALVASLGVVSNASAKTVSRQRQLQAAAAAALKPPPATLPASGRTLGGFTSQQMPVVLQISKKDKRIGLAGTTLAMTCTSGDQLTISDGWAKLPISKQGLVTSTLQVPPSAPTGSTVTVTGGTDTFSGKLNAKKATFSGKWRLHLAFTLPDNSTDECDSGPVTFKAVL